MPTVHQSFDSTLASAFAIEDLVLEHARQAGFRGPSLDHISLAVHETAVNAVIHGNQYAPDKKVRLDLELSGQALTVKIADEGAGFDPDAADGHEGGSLLRSSGRGVSLSRQVMDEYHVRRLKRGSEVTLTKYLAAPGSQIAATRHDVGSC
jgi:serine/threonine-protein kinase RsbW